VKLASRNLAYANLLEKLNSRRDFNVALAARTVATLVVLLVAPRVELWQNLLLVIDWLCNCKRVALAASDLRYEQIVHNEEFDNGRLKLLCQASDFVASAFATKSSSPRIDLALICEGHRVKFRTSHLDYVEASEV